MECNKKINLLDNSPNQPFEIRTRYWIELNEDRHGTYNTNSQIKFKTWMLRSNDVIIVTHIYL